MAEKSFNSIDGFSVGENPSTDVIDGDGNFSAAAFITRNNRNVPTFVYQNGTAPLSPLTGDQWYDTSTGILFEYVDDGITAAWVDMNGLPGTVLTGNVTVSNISVSNTANVTGNIVTGGIKTDNYYYANGAPFSGGSGGNGIPGGSNTQIQFNNAGAFGASNSLTFNSNTSVLSVLGSANIGNLTTTGLVNLGSVGNITITGGTAGQVLSTDGTGNLSWANGGTGGTAFAPITPTVDDFTGDGTTTVFDLSTAPGNINATTVNYNGATLLRSTYSIDGTTLTFSAAPADGAVIEVTTIYPGQELYNGNSNVTIATSNGNITMSVDSVSNVLVVASTGIAVTGNSNLGAAGSVYISGGTPGQFLSTDVTGALVWADVQSGSTAYVNDFTGDGTSTTFLLSQAPANINLTTVNYNGATLLRSAYTLAGANIVFSAPPADGAAIEVTVLRSGNIALGDSGNIYGTVSTPEQPLITSVGILSGLTTTGLTTVDSLVETTHTITGATGTVVHNMNGPSVFYHNTPTGNFTPNFTNVSTVSNRTITSELIIPQSSTPYVPTTSIQIDGVSQTVKWLSGTTPLGSASNVDSILYKFIRIGSTWTVLGQYKTYS